MLTRQDEELLHERFAEQLERNGPPATLLWLQNELAALTPGDRSMVCKLIAYTGCPEGIDWFETNAGSPVTSGWGTAAALLDVSWARIRTWLTGDGWHPLIALDALLAYRAPAPNMAPFEQIAAPALSDPPSRDELDDVLDSVLRARKTARIRQSIDAVRAHADEILSRRPRGVAVADLPRLFLAPDEFRGAGPIIEEQAKITSNLRESLRELLEDD